MKTIRHDHLESTGLGTGLGCHESTDNFPERDVIRGLPYGNSSSGALIRIDMNVRLFDLFRNRFFHQGEWYLKVVMEVKKTGTILCPLQYQKENS